MTTGTLRIAAGLAPAVLLLALLAGCRGEGNAGEGGGATPPRLADYFACGRDADCVVEPQRDCCPCNAGGREVAVSKGGLGGYRAARGARCAGDLLCPQVYLCDERAAAVCRAGRCELRGASPPGPPVTPR